MPLPADREQVKALIVSRARATNAVAVIMLGEAWMTKLTEKAIEKYEVIYAALRLYNDSLALKAARIVRENGRTRIGESINLGHGGEGHMIANILPSWKAGVQA